MAIYWRLAAPGMALLAGLGAPMPSIAGGPKVLQVGTYRGMQGAYTTIQDAVNAAVSGDWVLVAPGDYHEQGSANAGVLVTTPGIHIRGLDRNGVIVDGTKPGEAACSGRAAAQQIGGTGGRNGIEVLKADGVTVENLTACNFLSDANGQGGNQIWWNGGDGSGLIGLGSWYGQYLTASSTYYEAAVANVPEYGVFISNSRGPGLVERAYASNMGDSAFYIGGCPDCNATLRYVHAQNSALGYSGTNAGGHLSLEDSEWDHNRNGIVPSTLANSDPPSPQDGACPDGSGKSCTFIQRNYVHDNNDPNTPLALGSISPPVGVGIEISGGRNDTVRDNVIMHNGAWGILINDYPDPSSAQVSTYCQGGIINYSVPAPYNQILGATVPCYFFATGDRVRDNYMTGNGRFGNATNGDLANLSLPNSMSNCFDHNFGRGGGAVVTSPTNLQDRSVAGRCNQAWMPDTAQEISLLSQVICDSFGPGTGLCNGPGYPLATKPHLLPIPAQPSMPNVCRGVPANSWC